MEFKQLEAYVAVVEYNSFSQAAKHLYLTQPTVSAHVSALEQELNSRLIIRTTKKMTLTPRGKELYECAVRMLGMRNALIEEYNGRSQKIIELSVSTIPSSCILPELMTAFRAQEPDVCFHAWQSDSREAVDKVVQGQVDLALAGSLFDEETCCFLPFCTDRQVLVTPVSDHYRQYKEHGATFADFLQEPFLMRESGSGTRRAMERSLESQGVDVSSLHVAARMNDLESLRRAVACGLGVSILSERSARDLAEAGKILLFPLPDTAPDRTFYLVHNKNRILKPHATQFLHFAQDYYKSPSREP